MTNANMKLVVVDVPFADKLEIYDQKLDAGEFITRRVVELSKLSDELKGECKCVTGLKHPMISCHDGQHMRPRCV
jgi:hypothetical protein